MKYELIVDQGQRDLLERYGDDNRFLWNLMTQQLEYRFHLRCWCDASIPWSGGLKVEWMEIKDQFSLPLESGYCLVQEWHNTLRDHFRLGAVAPNYWVSGRSVWLWDLNGDSNLIEHEHLGVMRIIGSLEDGIDAAIGLVIQEGSRWMLKV